MECQEINDNETIIQVDEVQNYFYLIKQGEVKLMDRFYNYMYHLPAGSFFGEQQILLGILTDNIYKHVDRKNEMSMLLRIKASRFFKIIQEDFHTYKYFFNDSISRYRYQKKLKKLLQNRTYDLLADCHTCDKELKKEKRSMKLYDLMEINRSAFGKLNHQVNEFLQNIHH